MQRSLPELNAAIHEHKLPYRVYALHRGGEHEKARKIIDGKDTKNREWVVDFVWSSKEFEDQLGGVVGLPSYYLMDRDGRVRAMIKGHSKGTHETLLWLMEEIAKRG